MKLYQLKKDFIFAPNTIIPKGSRFYEYDDKDEFGLKLIPINSKDGIGISKSIVKNFDEWFEEIGTIKANEVPYLKKEMDEIEEEMSMLIYELNILKEL